MKGKGEVGDGVVGRCCLTSMSESESSFRLEVHLNKSDKCDSPMYLM